MHLLVLQRLEERFHVSVVVGIASPRHADLHLGLFKQGYILTTGILHPAIGVMNTSRWGLTCCQSHFQCCHTQLGIDPFGDRPADDLARVAIQDSGQEDKSLADANVGDVSHPGLVNSRQRLLCQKIRIDLVVMIRIGGGDLKALPADGK